MLFIYSLQQICFKAGELLYANWTEKKKLQKAF